MSLRFARPTSHLSRYLRPPPPSVEGGSDPDWWSYAPGLTQSMIDALPFSGSLSDPPVAPTIDSENDVTVSDATEFHAVTDGDGSSIETHVHIDTAISAADLRVNNSDVRVTGDADLVHDTTPSIDTFDLDNVTRVEWDGGDYDPDSRMTFTVGLGGNNSAVPTNVVFYRLNIRRGAGNPISDRLLSRSAYVRCRLKGSWSGLAFQPGSGQVCQDIFILGCTLEADDLGGVDEVLELDHEDEPSELSRIVIWNTMIEGSGGNEIRLGRCSDVAFLDSTLRAESITHDTGIGSGIVYRGMEVYTETTPTGTAEPGTWEWSDSTWYGRSESQFTTAMGTPDTFTGNTWDSITSPPAWPSDPDDPAELDP